MISEIGYLEGILDIDEYDEVIVLGDFNVDLRIEKSRLPRRLPSFIADWKLTV